MHLEFKRVVIMSLALLVILSSAFVTRAQEEKGPVVKKPLITQRPPFPQTTISSQKAAYVWADNPWEKNYRPSPSYSYNSSGEAITITRNNVGTYSVRFWGLGGSDPGTSGSGGNVLVTAYGGESEMCKVAGFYTENTTFLIDVRCFDTSGNPKDASYTARVTWPNTAFAKSGYAFADNPNLDRYKANAKYSYNSSGSTIEIVRNDIGSYEVRFAGLGGKGSAGGNVVVTAAGKGNETCKVAYWDSNGADFIASVRCFESNGKSVDALFSINVIW